MNILAIVAARNEVSHVCRCIPHLIGDGLEVVLIDHGSTDGTREAAERYLGNGLLGIIDLKWEGFFSLESQLLTKQSIIEGSLHDWVAHFDADEWPVPPNEFITLHDMVKTAESSGHNVINFNEYVFLPIQEKTYENSRYESLMRHYYFFEPHYPRLQRMWRRDCKLSNIGRGGHLLNGGEISQFPVDGHLRHYIALSAEHAIRKYSGRIFSEAELKRGWHNNRINITEKKIRSYFSINVACLSKVKALQSAFCRNFDKSDPIDKHFWDWHQ